MWLKAVFVKTEVKITVVKFVDLDLPEEGTASRMKIIAAIMVVNSRQLWLLLTVIINTLLLIHVTIDRCMMDVSDTLIIALREIRIICCTDSRHIMRNYKTMCF